MTTQHKSNRVAWGLVAGLAVVLLWSVVLFAATEGWQVMLLERNHWGFGSVASPPVFDEDFSPDAGCFRLGVIGVARWVYYQHR